MIKFTITITGTAPLLMHNGRLSNPLDPNTKALKRVTGKRQKTDDDHEMVARIEHAGSLYWDEEYGPFVPAENITRSLLDGAKMSKRGPKIVQGLLLETDVNPLAYHGPRDIDGLWGHEDFRHISSVKVGQQRVMRCRPIFRQWATEAVGAVDPALLDLSDLQDIADAAGAYKGLGDWRPRYGRFVAEVKAA